MFPARSLVCQHSQDQHELHKTQNLDAFACLRPVPGEWQQRVVMQICWFGKCTLLLGATQQYGAGWFLKRKRLQIIALLC